MAGIAKKLDSKGRLVLGPEFANSTVLVEKIGDGQFIIKTAEVVPVREAWLFKNEEALSLVKKGISEAANGKVVKAAKGNLSWLDKLKD
jgi:hypothetical protein